MTVPSPPGPAGPPEGPPGRLVAALLVLLALVPWFTRLGDPPLWDANEPFYAAPPREVLEWPEGDFWAPTFNGRTYFGHPPLSTWITVPFYAALGPSELAARLPMALAAAVTVLATFHLGSLAGGRRTGLLAALVLATTPKAWLVSRQLAGDVYLVALLTSAFALAAPSLTSGRRGPLAGAAVLLGLATLAKGPLVFVLFGGSLLVAWALARPRAPFGRLAPLRHLGLALLVAAPWFVAMQLRFPHFLEVHFGFHHFSRFFEGTLGERGPAFYLVALAGDAQPWILLLPLALHRAWRARDRHAAAVLPWALLVVTLAFFSISSGKRNVYLLPLYPALTVVVAPVLGDLLDGRRPALARLAGFALAVAGAGAAVFLVLFAQNEPRIAPEVGVLVGILALLAVLALVAGIAARGRLLVVGGIAGLSAGLLALGLLLPAVGRLRPVPRMAAEIRRLEDPAGPEPAVVYRARVTSLSYYLGRRTEKAADGPSLREVLGEAPRAFVLVPERRRAHLEAEAPWLSFEEVHRAPHLDFHFSKNVLGRGPSAEDLVLLRATRRP